MKKKGQNAAFIFMFCDFAKTFNSVNLDLAFSKLLNIGVRGKSTKAMFKSLKSCVNIYKQAIDWFSVEHGVRKNIAERRRYFCFHQ